MSINSEYINKIKKTKGFNNNKMLSSVLIKGSNGVGKSLFVKALCNSILTKLQLNPKKKNIQESISIIVFDIDVGQPVFGTP